MRAWIARDRDTSLYLFSDDPRFDDDYGQFFGDEIDAFDNDELEDVTKEIDLKPEFKQQIELTARPVGEAEGGES